MFGIPDQLLVTVLGNVVSAAMILAGGLFVLFSNVRGKLNRLFFFLTASTLLYQIFFIIAAVQKEYSSAYFWWFLNIFDVFITMAVVHLIFAVIKKDTEWRWLIVYTYLSGIAIFAYAWLDPSAFLPAVVPKLYFAYYLEAGWLYSVMLAHFLVLPLVAFVNLLVTYAYSGGIERRRYEYFILMLILGYAIGCLNFGLVYDIPIDPIFGMFLGFYILPIGYGIFASDLLDIRLVFRRGIFFGINVGLIAGFLIALILANQFLVNATPWLQFWTLPLIASLVAVIIGTAVWQQTKEADRLKYEFITIAAHKLRTPLTHIRWEIQALLSQTNDPALKEGIVRLDVANNRLVELTNILMEAAHTEDMAYGYKKDPVDLAVAVKNALQRFDAQIKEKQLSITTEIPPNLSMPAGDVSRIGSVIDVLIENAVIYNKKGGSVRIVLSNEGPAVRFSISDTGIGVDAEDMHRIFSSFYRSDPAKRADTEGVGIGLTVSKSIIEKHGGTMGAESPGEGRGSTFWFTLPAV